RGATANVRRQRTRRLQQCVVSGLWSVVGGWALIIHEGVRRPLSASLPDDLDEYAFRPLPIELTVEDLLPGTEIEFAVGDCNHNLMAHHLTLVMCVAVVLPSAVMIIAFGGGVERRQVLQPAGIVLV